MPAFLSIGVMYADFILDGTVPCCSDQRKSRHRNGARILTLAFSSHVGRGSDEHCLSGSACTSLMTSGGVTGRKNQSSQPTEAAVNCGAGSRAVASRTPATLSNGESWTIRLLQPSVSGFVASACVRARAGRFEHREGFVV